MGDFSQSGPCDKENLSAVLSNTDVEIYYYYYYFPMFIVKCGAASNLEPVLRMLCSDWSRHHMIFISMPLLKLKSTFTRSDF